MRPKIALTMSMLDEEYFKAHTDYFEAVWDHGGIAATVPYREDEEYINEIVNEFDGFIFCGGSDIDPKYYNEECTQSENICSKRDSFESKLFKKAYSENKPILGICRGIQGMNVFLGGSLIQHIEGHRQDMSREKCAHSVKIMSDGMLFKIAGSDIAQVNTFHHQAIKALAPSLAIDALSPDGIIEAVHDTGRNFCLGVQWHPENIYRNNNEASALFLAFVNACKHN